MLLMLCLLEVASLVAVAVDREINASVSSFAELNYSCASNILLNIAYTELVRYHRGGQSGDGMWLCRRTLSLDMYSCIKKRCAIEQGG
jgi:hypothetical protein